MASKIQTPSGSVIMTGTALVGQPGINFPVVPTQPMATSGTQASVQMLGTRLVGEGSNVPISSAQAPMHEESGSFHFDSNIEGEGGDYHDIVFAMPFKSTPNADQPSVIMDDEDDSPPAYVNVINLNSEGCRLQPASKFNGSSSYRFYRREYLDVPTQNVT